MAGSRLGTVPQCPARRISSSPHPPTLVFYSAPLFLVKWTPPSLHVLWRGSANIHSRARDTAHGREPRAQPASRAPAKRGGGRDRPSCTAGMSTYVYVDGDGEAGRWGAALGPQGPSRKPVQRRTVDYTATTVRHLEVRVHPRRYTMRTHERTPTQYPLVSGTLHATAR
jgi:hypothetical protein